MKNMYKYVPAILLSGELILLITISLINRHYNYNHDLIWMSFVIIQMIIITTCGILIKRLYQQTQIDMLTGLYSRKYFYTKLSELKSKAPVSLILIDIDNFKRINDTYGHTAGDKVLQQFAEILQCNSRRNDIAARWGGEEFVVILPQTDVKEAFKSADRIRRVVEKHIFSYEKNICKITVSVGIASTKERTEINIEQFFKIADKALYKAKEKKNFIITVEGC